MNTAYHATSRRGHTLMELVAASVASVVLLSGLGSVMFIAREIAYTPTSSVRRTETADIVNQISDDLRYATLILQQTPQILEFVVADRNGDGTAEKIRYQWSGTPGNALYKTVNTGSAIAVLDSVDAFAVSFQQKSKATALKTTADSAEAILASNASPSNLSDRDINASQFSAQQINPAAFTSPIPANALSWNATKVDFFSDKRNSADETLAVQLRSAGDPNNGPASQVLAEKLVAESTLSNGWNTATFTNPVRGLAFHRRYALVWGGIGGGDAAKLRYNDTAPRGVLESSDAGASWQFINTRQVFYRLYGTYTTPSTTYSVTRNYVTHVDLSLRSGSLALSRIDASIPLRNMPELLAARWRADFSTNPTATNANGDSALDWAYTGTGTFDPATLISGVWYVAGSLETRPLNDFVTPTFVDVRCRNTTVGGNGAVVRINADRQGGQYAPLLVYVQRQSDGTQNLTLLGKTSDAATKVLFTRTRLPDAFIRFRLTILPQNNVVNLTINEENQGTFTYPTYAPTSTTDRYFTLYRDTSLAEFDYVDVRLATN